MKSLWLYPLSLSCLFAGTALAQLERPMEPQPDLVQGLAIENTASRSIPSDAIVLFDGTNLDAWQRTSDGEPARWRIDEDVMTVERGMGTIKTKQRFGDIQLHLEWRPSSVIEGEGQSRGNSGVFLHSLFELQILDSWENPTYINGQAGSIYLQYPPLVNASKPPGQWQSYDIVFKAPVYIDNALSEPARITVLQNGVLVQDNVELLGATFTPTPEYGVLCATYSEPNVFQDCSGKMPLVLQDHGQVVSFRNIWIREL